MNKKAIVLYTSKRGSTQQYAEWIAQSLECECAALKDFDKYGEMGVLRIFDNSSLGSYYKFLIKYVLLSK